jgi:hypothetical protein
MDRAAISTAVDYDVDAADVLELLGEGAHVVVHSYGSFAVVQATLLPTTELWLQQEFEDEHGLFQLTEPMLGRMSA